VTERFKDRVVEEGTTPATVLDHCVGNYATLEDSLAEAMLSGQIKNGDTAIVDMMTVRFG